MKRYLFASALMFWVLGVCGSPGALADGDCFQNKELLGAFDKGAAAEKSGRLIDAFEAYGRARARFTCEGKNTRSEEADSAWKSVARRLGEEQDRRGHYYSGTPIYGRMPSDGGGSLASDKEVQNAGAFEWFEASEQFSLADQAMLKLVRSKPDHLETFEIAWSHLQQRKSNAASLKQNFNYAVDPGFQAALAGIASQGGMAALEREEQAFNRKTYNPATDKMTPIEQSISELKVARQWFSQFNDPKEAKVIERAKKRADALFKDDQEPTSLQQALAYYEIAQESEKINATRAKADRLGDASAQKDELVKAGRYYQIAGDDAKQKGLLARLKTESSQKKNDFLNDEQKQQQFKKDQENLEKELGF